MPPPAPRPAHPALPGPQGNSSKRNPLFTRRGSPSGTQPALRGAGAPTPGFVQCPERRPARLGHWSPTQSGSPPPPPRHLTGTGVTTPGLGRAGSSPGERSIPGPPTRPLPRSLQPSPGGSRHSAPSPSSPSQGRQPGGPARPAIPVRPGVKGLSGRSAGDGVVMWVGSCARGRRTP